MAVGTAGVGGPAEAGVAGTQDRFRTVIKK